MKKMSLIVILACFSIQTQAGSELEDVYGSPATFSQVKSSDIKEKGCKGKDEEEEGCKDEDSTDGQWLPVPIPVSNPTIGTGLQAALLYLHPQKTPDSPNATTGIGGMWTDSDSKFFGVFHDNNFFDDSFRLKTFAGVTDFNLEYFGFGEKRDNFSIKYNIKTTLASAELLFRIPKTEGWYFGPKILWVDAKVAFPIDNNRFEIDEFVLNSVTSSLGGFVEYDNRNNNYYPTKGQILTFSYLKDDPKWGSDYQYDKIVTKYRYYLEINSEQTVAFQGLLSNVEGRAPFYMMSNLSIRGAPFGRYIDNVAASLHAEWRYKFAQRWGVVGFIETGKVADTINLLNDSSTVQSYGVGLRWQAISSKALNVGMDVAFSEGEETLYIRVGESF